MIILLVGHVPRSLSLWWSELGRAVRSAIADPDHIDHGLFTITMQPTAGPDSTPVYWFGNSRIGSVLIEREQYRTLRDEVIHGWNQNPRDQTLIIGTPGIGKTMHMYYLMSYLRHRWEVDHAAWVAGEVGAPSPYELDIAYEYLAFGALTSRVGYRFRMDVNGNATVSYGRGDLEDPPANLYYLCDGCCPEFIDQRTLLVTSPNVQIYKPFLMKREAGMVIKRYMGLISHQLMEIMRPILFPHITADQLRERYAVIGGVMRPIKHGATKEVLIRRLREMAAQCTAHALISGQGGFQKTSEVSDVLLHFVVDENDDQHATLDFASQSVL